MKIEMLEKVFESLEIEKVIEEIETKIDYDFECGCESIYSNMYVYELLCEYLNEGCLDNFEKISSYWFRKSNEFLKKNGIHVFKEFEIQ